MGDKHHARDDGDVEDAGEDTGGGAGELVTPLEGGDHHGDEPFVLLCLCGIEMKEHM